jgi:hypothetical protein
MLDSKSTTVPAHDHAQHESHLRTLEPWIQCEAPSGTKLLHEPFPALSPPTISITILKRMFPAKRATRDARTAFERGRGG